MPHRPQILATFTTAGRQPSFEVSKLSVKCGAATRIISAGAKKFTSSTFRTIASLDVLLVLPGLVRSDDLNKHLLRNEGKIHLDFAGAQPSDEVADSVVRSLVKNRTEAAVGFASWWVWFGKRMFPRVVRFFMQRKVWKYAKREKAAS